MERVSDYLSIKVYDIITHTRPYYRPYRTMGVSYTLCCHLLEGVKTTSMRKYVCKSGPLLSTPTISLYSRLHIFTISGLIF